MEQPWYHQSTSTDDHLKQNYLYLYLYKKYHKLKFSVIYTRGY